MHNLASKDYRPDIDGLRALAVLIVVFFHAFPKVFKSGFIGVDIFFVLSGYLISSIIFSQLDRGKFSFREFYKRRILRIFPSLILVLAFALTLGYFVLLSSELKQLGKHIAAAASFTSNFVLWNESGYFDNASETKPLLHLWSLAIEEQFYVFYPLLLWGCWRLGIGFFRLVLFLIVASFSINIYFIHSQVVDFYMPLARFWELMIGAITVLLRPKLEPKSPTLKNLLSWSGATLLVLGILNINRETPFPGFWAIAPTLGTALMIGAGSQAWVNRWVLSKRTLVWVGGISYPLYLWHWIIFSMARVIEGDSANLWFRLVFIAVSFLLAWVSTVYIEHPIRFRKTSKPTEWVLLSSLLILGAAGLAVYLNSGLPSRDSSIQQIIKDGDTDHDSYNQYLVSHFPLCTPLTLRNEATRYNDSIRCYQSRSDIPVTTAILGDSHADHIFPGLAEVIKSKNFVFYTQRASPVLDSPEFRNIFNEVLSNSTITQVILNAYWADKSMPFQPLSKTVEKLIAAKKQVYLFDDVPDYWFDPSKCRISRVLRSGNTCTRPKAGFVSQMVSVQETMRALKVAFPALHLVHSSRYFCDVDACSMSSGREILYRDSNHLNIVGSRFLAEKLLKDYPELGRR